MYTHKISHQSRALRTPSVIKHCCQDMLTAQWTRKLPLIQQTAPAKLAARLIHTFLDDFPDIDTEQYFVIDFCSGAGGKRINYVHAIRAPASNAPETGLPATISANFQNWSETESCYSQAWGRWERMQRLLIMGHRPQREHRVYTQSDGDTLLKHLTIHTPRVLKFVTDTAVKMHDDFRK